MGRKFEVFESAKEIFHESGNADDGDHVFRCVSREVSKFRNVRLKDTRCAVALQFFVEDAAEKKQQMTFTEKLFVDKTTSGTFTRNFELVFVE